MLLKAHNKALHLTAKSATSLRSILLLAASELSRYAQMEFK